MSLVTGLFFLVLLLNQRWSPPLRLQASHCSTFRIMCDVPSIAVFCSESIECFPGTASKFFLKLFVTTPVAPIVTGIIVHFSFHIRCISVHKLLYYYYYYFITLSLSQIIQGRMVRWIMSDNLKKFRMQWVPLHGGSILTFFRRHRGEPQPSVNLVFRPRFEPGTNQM